jgi:hypothetical protein
VVQNDQFSGRIHVNPLRRRRFSNRVPVAYHPQTRYHFEDVLSLLWLFASHQIGFQIMRNARVLALFVSIGYLSLAMGESAVDQSAAIQKIKAFGGNVERNATGKSNSVVTISLVGCTKLKDEDLAVLDAFPDVNQLDSLV